ncbi:MAG: hypothetical protein ACRDOI_39725 [Trebonia sp.]
MPGDSAQIGQEAQHLASVASEITNQVTALRKISSDGTEVGKHADKIRSSASDLAGELDKVVGRYQKVSSALNDWIPELEQAQAMSIRALDQAEGPYQKLHQTVALPSGPNLTAQQKQDVASYNSAMKAAQADLAAAQALLGRATSLRDSAGSHTASLIKDACNDGMKDHHSLWGSITGFFSHAVHWVAAHWTEILKDVCTVLEVVATVLAVAAFIIAQFIPGLDVLIDGLVIAGMIATGAALGGRIALAATGNGSWLDVGIDAFALLTFGLGRLAGAAAKTLLPELEAGSKTAFLTDLIAGDSKAGAMLSKFADLMGSNKATLAIKFADSAPKVADGAELNGFTKVMMNIGGFGKEEETYAKLIKLGTTFARDNNNLGEFASISKALAGFTGISTATADAAAVSATVVNGWSTNFLGTLDAPSLHNWFSTHLEVPLGEPSGG